MTKRGVYTSEDNQKLLECDGNGLTNKILKSSQKGKGSQLDLWGVKLDPGFEAYMKFPKTEQEVMTQVLNKQAGQKTDSPIYWNLGQSKVALALKTKTFPITTEAQKVGVQSDLYVYRYTNRETDIKRNATFTEGDSYQRLVFEAAMDEKKYDKRFSFQFDPNTAFWLKARTDRIAKCMEKDSAIAEGSDRNSIRSYILGRLVQPSIQPLIPQ
jgi:hypothetical protein